MNTVSQPRMTGGYQADHLYPSSPLTPRSWRERVIFNKLALASKNLPSVFQNYTGKGGLHGLRRYDFSSFKEYTARKQSFEMGQFFTPDEVCQTVVEILEIEPGKVVADICCGNGSFFNYLGGCELYGVEMDKEVCAVAQKLFPTAGIQHADMQHMQPIPLCDYIVGNPPFDLPLYVPRHPLSIYGGKILSQHFHLARCWKYLKMGGYMGLVYPHFRKPTANRAVKEFLQKHFDLLAVVFLPGSIFRKERVNLTTKIFILQKKMKEIATPVPRFRIKFISRKQVVQAWRSSPTYQLLLQRKQQANTLKQ